MWDDFIEAFGYRFDKREERFQKVSLFVVELKKWIDWQNMNHGRNLIIVGTISFTIGLIFGSFISMVIILNAQ